MSQIFVYQGDLPDNIVFHGAVAVDTETMGLNLHRDRLCLVQLSAGDGTAVLVQILPQTDCPNLKKLLTDQNILKIFHFARFDVAKIMHDLGVVTTPVYCTKIASKLSRTSSPSHSLKSLCHDLLNIDLQKEQQTSDWGVAELSEAQKQYAANDVLYLHQLKEKTENLLKREGRYHLAQACFQFLPIRAELDLQDFSDPDIFAH